jgi:Big-like domain-containing protein/MBG domain-containing protein
VNGRLVHTAQLTGTLTTTGNPLANMTIGGRNDVPATLIGTLDDLMIFDDALSDSDVDSLALSGAGSLCAPFASSISLTAPPTIVYGTTFQVSALLTDGAGRPLANRPLTITSAVTPGYVHHVTTNENGSVTVMFPINSSWTVGEYPDAIEATFDGDDAFIAAAAHASVTLAGGTPTLNWSQPAPITYGTPLSSVQLNATTNFPGTIVYSPPVGTVLAAGTHTLSVTLTPTDADHWAARTVTTTIVVNKATPIMGAFGDITETYDGLPHGVSVTVAGVSNEWLTPVTVTYNGSTTPPIGAGVYAIDARYDGSANYDAVSHTATLTILKAAPYLTWTYPASITYGTPLGAAQLNATANTSGTFAYSLAAGTVLDAGTHIVSVSFTPDDAANYGTGSASVPVTVTKAVSVVAWNNPANIVYGTALGVAQLNATASVPGTFTYSPAAGAVLSAGAYTLSATFTPADATNYSGSSTNRTLTVARAPLSIVAANSWKPFGAPLPPFSATGSGFVNGDSFASLSGILSFSTIATPASPVGVYSVAPLGLSSANYTIAFVSGSLSVAQAATTTAVAATPNPSGFNQPVTLTATVAPVAPGAGSPGGSMQFFDGGTLLGTATLSEGTAALTTNGFAAGSHTISATYSGDASFTGSSGSVGLTVNPASSSSTTTVTSSANPATVGQTMTLTATITAPSSPAGNAQFYDGAALLGTAVVSGTTARLTTASLVGGGHAITAVYLGNGQIPPSTSPAFAQYVQPSGAKTRASTVALAASPSPATLGSNVTLTATATGSSHQPPTGQVMFMLNGTVLGQGTLSSTGTVTAATALATSALPHGTHTIAVVYLGDATYRASTTSITLVVN